MLASDNSRLTDPCSGAQTRNRQPSLLQCVYVMRRVRSYRFPIIQFYDHALVAKKVDGVFDGYLFLLGEGVDEDDAGKANRRWGEITRLVCKIEYNQKCRLPF